MKVERTKSGNIKVVMSEEAARCFCDIIGGTSKEVAITKTTLINWNASYNVWNALDDLLHEENK